MSSSPPTSGSGNNVVYTHTEHEQLLRGLNAAIDERDALQLELHQERLRSDRLRAVSRWAIGQLRAWWRGDRRDISRPNLALAELDRIEKELDV